MSFFRPARQGPCIVDIAAHNDKLGIYVDGVKSSFWIKGIGFADGPPH
jgi:hypothetical protein